MIYENDNDREILLGKMWQAARKAKGFTQEYVAEKLDLGPRYLSDLERDKTIGSIKTLINLCNIYEITPTYILQDYLNIDKDLKIDSELIGYYSLNKRDRDILILRYGLNNSEEYTQKEVADMLNISQSYISRIEKKAIKKLKDLMKV